MLTLSDDPDKAQDEMSGIIFYLVTFGYIDGHLDPDEMDFIKRVIHQVVEYRVDHPPEGADPGDRDEQLELYNSYFDEVITLAQKEVEELMRESVAQEETRGDFVTSKLKQRAFETFQSFAPEQQKTLLASVNGLLWADGDAHPAELKLRQELIKLLENKFEDAADPVLIPRNTTVKELAALPHEPAQHPYFEPLEKPYPKGPKEIEQTLEQDRANIHTIQTLLEQRRRLGQGHLDGQRTVEGLQDAGPFLQDTVFVHPMHPKRKYELTVLGDLHGCYSCFKAALMQSAFLDRLEAFRRDPVNAPEPKLILLGDYLDRGKFGFEGVLRLALQLMAAAPEHVSLIRGNHEHLVQDDANDRIDSAVRPAESIAYLREIAPRSLLYAYGEMFESLPHVLLFGRMMFTHGGIPADGVVENAERDLQSLNEPMTKFQMRWSDPSTADVIPRQLQSESYRFGFGRLQARAFLQRLGCHTLIRGHEKIEDGFQTKFDDSHVQLITLFSAGGMDNDDLPPRSGYRNVRPMALTIRHEGGLDGETAIEAWPIDYAPYNQPEFNGFYAPPVDESAAAPDAEPEEKPTEDEAGEEKEAVDEEPPPTPDSEDTADPAEGNGDESEDEPAKDE